MVYRELLCILHKGIIIEIKEIFTVKDFENKSNIKEQMGRKQLNRFEKLGLLLSFRYSKGGTKHYKSLLNEER